MAIHIDWQPLPSTNADDETCYFPRLKGNGTVDFETLCQLAAEHNSVFHRGELLAAFDLLRREISHQLASGKAVRIPEFGTFRLTVEASGKIGATKRSSKGSVRLKGIAFSPEKEFVNSLGKLDFHCTPNGPRHPVCELNQMKDKLTDYFAAHSSITCAEFSALFHLGRSTANKYLKQLLNDGFLTRTGLGKHTRYGLKA